jgi:hypothetical protein
MGARQNNLHYAQQCAKLGLHVFPCRPEDKYPLVKWRKLSTTEPEQIKQWWAEWPDALPGIDLAKSGHVVIDGDRHGGPDGVVAVEQLFAEHNASLTDAPGVVTPRNGRHSWFKQPNGKPLGNRDKPIRNFGINIRGAGGYVIAPGAQLPDGRGYTRDNDTPNLFLALRENTVPLLPEWFAKLLRPKVRRDHENTPQPAHNLNSNSNRHYRYAEAALDRLCDELSGTAEGSRNIELNNAALRMGHMVASGWIDRTLVEQRLTDAAAATGLPLDEIHKTLASGINAGMQEPEPELVDRPQQHKRNDRSDAEQSEQQEQSEDDENGNELPPEAEDAIALVFAERHANELRYVNAWGRWISFEGTHWIEDNTLHTFDRVRAVCREIATAGEHSPRVVASAKTIVAVERLARADRRLAATAGQWDNNSWMLNEKNRG